MNAVIPGYLVGLTGPAGCGKDTVADHLQKSHGYARYALAGPIKAMLNGAFGWTPEQWEDRAWKEARNDRLGFSPRRAAQTLGTEWGRALNSRLWLLLAESFIHTHRALDAYSPIGRGIVISDIRFEDEAQWMRNLGGSLWHIRREQYTAVEAHSSEVGVKVEPLDLVIWNQRDIPYLHGLVDAVMA